MQLPDEAITYQYQSLLVPAVEEWGSAAELRTKHFLQPARLRALLPQLTAVRSQVATERELKEVPAELKPLQSGFIDLPQQYLDRLRRKGDASELGRIMSLAARMKGQADRVVILGVGGSLLG